MQAWPHPSQKPPQKKDKQTNKAAKLVSRSDSHEQLGRDGLSSLFSDKKNNTTTWRFYSKLLTRVTHSHGSGHDLHHPFHHGDHRQVVHQHQGEDSDFEASKLTDRQHHCQHPLHHQQHQKHFKS
jgi:hypothetical protein